MKQTGVTRKIDELGRIVIPKEIRKNLGIRDGESLEIFTSDDSIILKKYYEVKKLEDVCDKLCEMIKNIYDVNILITDREKVVSSSISNYKDKLLDKDLIELIDERELLISDKLLTKKIGNYEVNGYYTVVPIVVSGDSLGLVIIVDEVKTYERLAKLVAKIVVDKVDIF